MGLAFLLLILGIAGFAAGYRKLARLEHEVARLRDRLDRALAPASGEVAPGETAPTAAREDAARAVARPREDRPPSEAEAIPAIVAGAPPDDVERASAPPRRTVESLVGAQLPIWVGGAALVVAAFFLVRYSIDSGLLGPGVRVVLAALFSTALIAASEVARRLPATRGDVRVGQVLAGAGIASAYGTLYVAAAQYHLIGALAGFLLMIAITAGALALALRHGPPTAIMALIGGFSAPLVAGFDAAGVGPLLVYLALFIAALFALAAQRGWRWLAVVAIVAGFGWANLLIVLLDGRDTAGVGAFVVALAIGATLALPRASDATRWLRAAPLVAGFVQLLVLAPTLDFGPVAWTFHLVLAAAALALARRDAALLPAALPSALLVTIVVAAGLLSGDLAATPVAAALAAALFAATGIAFSRRAPAWAGVALVGIAGPLLAAHLLAPSLARAALWSAFELAAAALAAVLAWRHRDRVGVRDVGLVGGTAVAALLAIVALTTATTAGWRPIAAVPAMLLLGAWAQRTNDRDLARLPAITLIAIAALAAEPFAQWLVMLGSAVAGTALTYPLLPTLADVARMIAAPAIAAAALLAWPRSYGTARAQVAAALAIVAALCLYTLAKQPLAIADDARFVAVGFGERAAITLAFAAAGCALATATRFRRTGTALIVLALARFAWFDIVVHDPVVVAQRVGPLPLVNAAVLLPALLALACWRTHRALPWRWTTLALGFVAVVAAVRQAAHGSVLTGALGNGENWGYSAALLALASAWLWRGLTSGQRDVRIAALALLTLVTVKVFLVDVAALGGLLRILSFLGLGVALIGIGWAYNRLIARPTGADAQPSR